MTGTGTNNSRGHFARVDADDTSPSFCGRELQPGSRFTDPGAEPTVCKTCLRLVTKKRGFDQHHHIVFKDGRWVVEFNSIFTTWSITGNNICSWATKCRHAGCDHMIQHPVSSAWNTGTTCQTYTRWAVAA